jgi:putative DNA primase/helicase
MTAEPVSLERARERAAERKAAALQTDGGNAELLATRHGDSLRFAPGIGWLTWDGRRWCRDDDGEVMRRARQVAKHLLTEAASVEDPDERKRAVSHALKSDNAPRLRAMIEIAQSEPSLIVKAELLDADPMLLTCANGTIDLRTGELRDHDPADLITQMTGVAYDATATATHFDQFIAEVFGADRDLIEFVQRFIGYCLTGDTREHVLAVFHGTGCNGKSTLVGTLRQLLGDYATTAAFDTFAQTYAGGPRNDLARLRGARFVTASESGRGQALDEATLKEITGGDRIAARFLYREHFEYDAQFKLVLTTNHRPRIDPSDDAIWRRLRLVPFNESFEGREDRDLRTKLSAELPGILAWAVAGCLNWQREGLGQATAVASATAAYRQDEDVLGAFLTDCCERTGDIGTGALRAAYTAWCERNGEPPLSAKALGQDLTKRGIESRRTKAQRYYVGVRLRGDR